AKKTVRVFSCQSPITENTTASPTSVIARARGSHFANGERARTVSSAANGKMKNASSLLPSSRSSAQRIETASSATNAAAAAATPNGSSGTDPLKERKTSASAADASTA